MDDDKPTPLWRKLLAAAAFLAVIACIIGFWNRLGHDFWPIDRSFVGPNLLASVIQWAVIFVIAVLLWPPWRRRLHRFVDRKLEPLHKKVDALHVCHREHAKSLASLHAKIDALSKEKNGNE